MYGTLNLLSFLLGLAAWAVPVAAVIRKKGGGAGLSFGLCALALLFQVVYTQHLVDIRDWSALEDTHYAVVSAAWVLMTVTAGLNLTAWAVNKRRK